MASPEIIKQSQGTVYPSFKIMISPGKIFLN
jgi:hypothetical protein